MRLQRGIFNTLLKAEDLGPWNRHILRVFGRLSSLILCGLPCTLINDAFLKIQILMEID